MMVCDVYFELLFKVAIEVFSTIFISLHNTSLLLFTGLEMIARQSQLTDNHKFMSSGLPTEVYEAVVAQLLVKDLHLVVNALEAAYSLSCLGSEACDRLVAVTGCLPVLLSLLTLEAQAMGTEGLIRVKIMQGPTAPAQQLVGQVRLAPPHALMPPSSTAPGPRLPAPVTAKPLQNAHTLARLQVRATTPHTQQQTQQQQQSAAFVPIAPKPNARPPLPQQLQQQAQQQQVQGSRGQTPARKGSAPNGASDHLAPHPHSVMHTYEHDPQAPTDKREFTLYWLKKYFEPYPQASVSRVHIYMEFQRAYSKQFQQLTNVTALEFHSCVK